MVKHPSSQFKISKETLDLTVDGQSLVKYTVSNGQGLELSVLNYGGIITSLKMPDKLGLYENVVLGFDCIEDYLSNLAYIGALIGRCSNRIAEARFTLENTIYQLDQNEGANNLHGGNRGFDKVIWTINPILKKNSVELELTYLSPDGEGGFPGNLAVTVIYTLKSDFVFTISYMATTDKKTIVDLTQHSYFNLSANRENEILDHVIKIDARHYIPVNPKLVPIGEFLAVDNTVFDFLKPKTISMAMEKGNVECELQWNPAFNQFYVLTNQNKRNLTFAASAHHPESGRFMEVWTDTPGLQFYTGYFLDKSMPTTADQKFKKNTGFCFETHNPPNAANEKKFPSIHLDVGEVYHSNTTFKFSVFETN